MKKKYKVYLKLNLMSLFFIALSFISITFAWFAYSGLAKVSTDIGVKSWYIELKKGEQKVSNDIVISLDNIYPGMDKKNEQIFVENLGDLDAEVNYDISSVRIFDEDLKINDFEEGQLEDQLAHDYPFHININLNKKFAVAKEGKSILDVSVSWPLDSGNDQEDSEWGKKAYDFIETEEQKYQTDNSYQKRVPIKLVINLKAQQYLEDEKLSDMNYGLGDIVLYDVINNKKCNSITSTCLKNYVIDIDNKVGDDTVTLLPDIYGDYPLSTYNNYDTSLNSVTSKWNVTTRPLQLKDILTVISTDIVNSILKRENLSDAIIGNLKYKDRLTKELEKAKQDNGYFTYSNNSFMYLATNKCYWLKDEFDDSNSFAFTKIDDENSKIYKEDKNNSCNVIPVIEIEKNTI